MLAVADDDDDVDVVVLDAAEQRRADGSLGVADGLERGDLMTGGGRAVGDDVLERHDLAAGRGRIRDREDGDVNAGGLHAALS